jgi:ubiquitin-conjugating enzyme E2 R
MSGETAAERWSPAQRVESVLISILSLLDDPECSSPANVDASVMLRKHPDQYRAKVREIVDLSQKDIPVGFIMPTSAAIQTAATDAASKEVSMTLHRADDDDFWVDSDAGEEGLFGGSDSSDMEPESEEPDFATDDDDPMDDGED